MFTQIFLMTTALFVICAFTIEVSREAAQSSVAAEHLVAWGIEMPHSPPKLGNVPNRHRVDECN